MKKNKVHVTKFGLKHMDFELIFNMYKLLSIVKKVPIR